MLFGIRNSAQSNVWKCLWAAFGFGIHPILLLFDFACVGSRSRNLRAFFFTIKDRFLRNVFTILNGGPCPGLLGALCCSCVTEGIALSMPVFTGISPVIILAQHVATCLEASRLLVINLVSRKSIDILGAMQGNEWQWQSLTQIMGKNNGNK